MGFCWYADGAVRTLSIKDVQRLSFQPVAMGATWFVATCCVFVGRIWQWHFCGKQLQHVATNSCNKQLQHYDSNSQFSSPWWNVLALHVFDLRQEPTSPTSPTCPSTCSSSAARLTYESDGKDQITAWAEDLSDTVRCSANWCQTDTFMRLLWCFQDLDLVWHCDIQFSEVLIL